MTLLNIDAIVRLNEAADGCGVLDFDGDSAEARLQLRGHEAATVRLHDRANGERLALGKRATGYGADKIRLRRGLIRKPNEAWRD
jgi:hypothetical protein